MQKQRKDLKRGPKAFLNRGRVGGARVELSPKRGVVRSKGRSGRLSPRCREKFELFKKRSFGGEKEEIRTREKNTTPLVKGKI